MTIEEISINTNILQFELNFVTLKPTLPVRIRVNVWDKTSYLRRKED